MGLFSKRAEVRPKISVNGIVFEYEESVGWSFGYRGTEFVAFTHDFKCPNAADLDAILATLEKLRAEMIRRLQVGLADYGPAAKAESGKLFVDVSDWESEKCIVATWSDGEGWGDLGADFEIKDGTIVDESWGD